MEDGGSAVDMREREREREELSSSSSRVFFVVVEKSVKRESGGCCVGKSV